MRKLFALLSLLVLASMILSACGGTPAPATQAPQATKEPSQEPATTSEPATSGVASKDPTTFLQAVIGEPESLDPALAYETAGGEIIQNVYETLVFYDGIATDKFVPMLAEEMPTISE